MIWQSLLPLLPLASAAVLPHADVFSGLNSTNDFVKRQGSSRAVTGANDGQICTRLSLRVLQANTDQWNLYLMATDNLKNMDQSAALSFYDVASVHGVPAQPWDGVQGEWNGNTAPGYCTHSSPVFPPWHRVYMALYEQALLASARQVVSTFSGDEQTRYQNALNCLRIPYFDWAQGPGKAATVVPDTLTTKEVTIPTPGGGSKTIINPIFRYDFHPLDAAAMNQDPWDFWPTTLRYPTTDASPDTYSQEDQVTSSIQDQAQSIHDQMYMVFTQCTNFMELADGQPLSGGCSESFETLHNSIHNLLGGSNKGHMTYLWWSAFDPVFFIHHANVDRLFAMWQVLYPDSYITSGASAMGTYSQPTGTVYDGNTPLDPFHRTDGSSWTANQARDVSTFGYTYTELQQANGDAGTMRNIVNQLYGTGAASVASKRDAANATAEFNSLPVNLNALLTPKGRKTDYKANIVAQRFGLDDSFNIYLFDGKPSTSDPLQYGHATNLIGSQGIFANPGMTMHKVLSRGSVSLTSTLVDAVHRGDLKSLDQADVTPYLHDNLEWRIVTASGKEVAADQVPGFKIAVVHSNVTPAAADTDFPSWSPFETLADITEGLLGGLGLGQTWEQLMNIL